MTSLSMPTGLSLYFLSQLLFVFPLPWVFPPLHLVSQSDDSDDDEIDGDDKIQKSRNDEDQDSGDQGRYWL
jgi:hypothetical protein